MKNRNFALTALSGALCAAFAQMAVAEDNLAEFISPNASSISIGAGNWSDRRMQQGKYDGMRDSGTYGTLDGSYLNRDDATGTWTSLYINNLGLDTVEFGGRYEVQGNWGVELDYSRINRDNPVTINTGLLGLGTQRQTVKIVTPGAGRDVYLDLTRDGTTVSGFKRFSPELELKVSFKNEEKEGNRQWGVRTYRLLGCSSSKGAGACVDSSYPAFVAEPINSTTRQMDASLNYQDKKLSVVAGYYGSWYDNHNTRLDVIGTAAGQVTMALPPDNQAHQAYVRANYMFTPTTRGLFKVAYTHATQDEKFIPTLNNNIASWAKLPSTGNSLNGEVNTTDVLMSLSSRAMPGLLLKADASYYERDDRTPVRVTAGTAPGTLYHNNPFDFANTKVKLEADYRLTDLFSLNGGYEYFHQKRSISDQINKAKELFVPYRKTLDEDTYRIALRSSLAEDLSGSIGYSYSDRDGSRYLDASNDVDSATISPAYIADRQRDKVKVTMDWTVNSAFGLQAVYAYSKDKYPTQGARVDGVKEGTSDIFTLDANWTINDSWKANAFYSTEYIRLRVKGPIGPAPVVANWKENTLDRADTFGLGIDGKVSEALTAGAKFEMTNSYGEFKQNPSSASPLPNVENRERRLNLFGDYAIQKNSSIRLDVIYETYKTDDWQWRFATGNPFSYAIEGTRVTNDRDVSATFIGARYTYKFQ